MTGVEISILALTAAAIVLRAARLGPEWLAVAAIVLVCAVIVLRLWANAARWQMAPAYLVAACLAAATLAGVEIGGLARLAASTAGLALLAFSAALASGFPVRALPSPAGSHPVGVTTARLERVAGEGDVRRLLVKVWYPAAPDSAARSREPLWSELYGGAEAPALIRMLTRYLREVKTHAYVGAPIAEADRPYPLVVYNHALVSIASENTLLVERLASEGLVVASVRHLDQAAELAAIQAALPDTERARDREIQAQLAGDLEREERARLSAELYRTSTGMPVIVERRAEDARFVVDSIGSILEAIPGAERRNLVDAERYGALGLSLGGAVSTRLCADDPRCAAVANLDGGLFGVDEQAPIEARYLMLYSERSAGGNDGLKAVLGPRYEERIFLAARHLDFHDAAVAAPGLRLTGALGPAGRRVNAEKNDVVAAFFRKALLEEGREDERTPRRSVDGDVKFRRVR